MTSYTLNGQVFEIRNSQTEGMVAVGVDIIEPAPHPSGQPLRPSSGQVFLNIPTEDAAAFLPGNKVTVTLTSVG